MLHLYPKHHGLLLSTICLRAEQHPQLTGTGVQSTHWPFKILSSLMDKYRAMLGVSLWIPKASRGMPWQAKSHLPLFCPLGLQSNQLTTNRISLPTLNCTLNEHTLPHLHRRFRCAVYYLILHFSSFLFKQLLQCQFIWADKQMYGSSGPV